MALLGCPSDINEYADTAVTERTVSWDSPPTFVSNRLWWRERDEGRGTWWSVAWSLILFLTHTLIHVCMFVLLPIAASSSLCVRNTAAVCRSVHAAAAP